MVDRKFAYDINALQIMFCLDGLADSFDQCKVPNQWFWSLLEGEGEQIESTFNLKSE